MPGPARAGAVLFSKSLDSMVRFYAAVLLMECLHQDADHAVLENADLQLVLHAIPVHIADGIHISDPPARREQVPVKLFASVSDIEVARQSVQALGGDVFGTPWTELGFVAVDVSDPEGNVLQLRVWPA